MRRAALFAVLLFVFALTGCSKEGLESQLLVIILGVDRTQDGVKLTVKAPSNASSGDSSQQSASQGGDQKGYLMLEATGKDFIEALSVLNAATPRTLNFSQTREIVIGMKAAEREDFGATLEALVTLPRIRDHAVMIVCNGEAYELIDAHKPYLGVRLSTYIETSILNYEEKGFIPHTSLVETHRDFGYGHADPLLICGGVNKFSQQTDKEKTQPEDISAGEMPRKSVNQVEMLGAAATDGARVSGTLTGYETALINLARGRVEGLEISLPARYVTVTPRYAATLAVDRSGGQAVLSVDLTIDVNKAPGMAIDLSDVTRLIEDDLTKTIRKLQSYRCDGMGFGNIAARGTLTVGDLNALNWRETYCAADVRVRVQAAFMEK